MEVPLAHLTGEERARYVSQMFARISRRYDRLNTIMSAGRHHAWRRMAADTAVAGMRGAALDVAAGTGDLAIELAGRTEVARVVGLDFTREMLELAVRKTRPHDSWAKASYVDGDAHTLPFADDRFICATVAFGVRNFVDPVRALREMARVVRPGGRVVTLEIVRQEGVGLLLGLGFRYVTPLLGAIFAGDREAYTYLPRSAEVFLSARELVESMREAGLENVTFRSLALGAVAIHVGEKPV